MGRISVNDVITALIEGGIPAQNAFPAKKMTGITESVAAVSILNAALKGQTMTILVTILTPAVIGAAACENKALEAGGILSEIGGDCTVKKCVFNGQTGLFQADIHARFLTEIPHVAINNSLLGNVVAFTSWRAVDPDLQVEDILHASWNFRLEEFFPVGVDEDSDCTEPFELMYVSCTGTESYQGCKWTYQKRIWGSTGIRQIRLGTAEMMDKG